MSGPESTMIMLSLRAVSTKREHVAKPVPQDSDEVQMSSSVDLACEHFGMRGSL